VIDAGLIWVGPKPASIRAMGLKDAAKKLMQEAGVPTTPGYLGEDQAPDRLKAEADAIGYPVLIKAVAGGGGKGMRRVDSPADFLDSLQSCQREAASAFGDDRVLIEKYIRSPRHIEVQVFGDSHGNVVHLFERDCSLQRRHQKVIEEAPAPGMDEATREAVCAAAVRAARAVDYEGAGTIEFIADASDGLRADRIWFMEMNTRLQVEHPVTEEITKQDLVEWQLRVASGETLPKRQDELSITGWAMEARLYAEDPAKGFLPSVGRLDQLHFGNYRWNGSVRVETGVAEGDEVSPFYDPMIAKLIVHRDDRASAVTALAAVTRRVTVWPVKTNAGFLTRALNDADFMAGRIDTGLIERKAAELIPSGEPSARVLQEAADHAAFVLAKHGEEEEFSGSSAVVTLWSGLDGFRLNRQPSRQSWLYSGAKTYAVERPQQRSKERHSERPNARYMSAGLLVTDFGESFLFGRYSGAAAGGFAADGAILSPMPGRIIAVEAAAGEAVAKGQKLVTLEAMKMEHTLTAPFDGVVAELSAEEGAQVSEGALLARVERKE
jgi:3-methylcrotonyl-CoA carboxylase alpha subunit